MAIRLPPTGTLVSRNGYLVGLALKQTSRLREHEVLSVRHVAVSVIRDVFGQCTPDFKAGTNDGSIGEMHPLRRVHLFLRDVFREAVPRNDETIPL